MAIIYVDLVNGNDSNNGTTFALRKKTLTSANAAMGNGDTVRVMQSPNPTLVGNATWTRDSKTVTLAAPVTANVDMCESGWVASSNVTVTYVSPGKEGTNCAQFAIGAGFTSGKVAYKALSGADDFNTFAALSLWLKQTLGTLSTANDFSIKICSDGTGNAPLINGTFDFPHTTVGSLNQWMAMTKEGTGNIGSGIQSVALYCNTNKGARTIQLDDIIVCKTSAAANSLSLTSLISKNNGTDAWAPIRSINGTTIILDQAVNVTAADNTCAYAGTTETVPMYKRECIRFAQMNTSATDTITGMTWPTGGTAVARRYISGGWNTTDMSTKTGETYLDFVNGLGWALSLSGANTTMDDINITRSGVAVFTVGSGIEINAHSWVGHTTGALLVSTATNSTYNIVNVAYNGLSSTSATINYSGGGAAGNTFNITNLCSNYGLGVVVTAVNAASAGTGAQYRETYNLGTVGNNGTAGVAVGSLVDGAVNIGKAFGPYPLVIGSTSGASYVLAGQQPYNSTFKVTDSIACAAAGVDTIRVFTASDCTLDLRGATVTAQSSTLNAILLSHNADITVLGGTVTLGRVSFDIADSLFVGTTFASSPRANDIAAYSAKVTVQNYNGVEGDNRIYTPIGLISTSTAQRHTASGKSWNMINVGAGGSTTVTPPGFYNELPVASVAVAANSLVTASIWVYRDLATVGARLTVKGGQIAGVPTDVVATASGAINTWEQITVTFTPTADGVVTFTVQHSSPLSNNHNAWFDDFDVSQA